MAQNQLQVIEGGISAGYFNALEKNLPVTIVMDRVSSPLGHKLMLRPDLKGQITELSQLKGKVIASNGAGSVSTYEVGKMLETDGLTLADVDVKVFPFPQMAIGFQNKAIDAAIVIPPFTSTFLDKGIARRLHGPGRSRQAAPADDRGEHAQHRLGEGERKGRAQLLLRLPARRARLLQRLSRRQDPRRRWSIS